IPIVTDSIEESSETLLVNLTQANNGFITDSQATGTIIDDDAPAQNQPPVNSVPGTQSMNEDATLVFSVANSNLISISDPDAATGALQVTLTVTNGTLSLSGTTGLNFTGGDGTADAAMTFTGTLANINTALSGMSFTPTANFSGSSTLSITTNDQG